MDKALMSPWDLFFFQYVEEDDFVDAIKALSSTKKEHTMFNDTHL